MTKKKTNAKAKTRKAKSNDDQEKRVRNCMVVTDVVHPKTGETILTEEQIKTGLDKLMKSGWLQDYAYILHDQDVYDDEDVAAAAARVSADDSATDKTVPAAGTPKPAHWHICLSAKRGRDGKQKQIRISTVANAFGLGTSFIQTSRHDTSMTMPCMLAYIVHDPDMSHTDGKFAYPHDAVKTNIPEWEKRVAVMFESGGSAKVEEYLTRLKNRIMVDGLTLKAATEELMLRVSADPSDPAYTRIYRELEQLRLEYISHQPLPSHRMNFYIDGEGGAGKTTLAKMMACSLFPNLPEDEVYFICGSKNVTFDGYDGQPVIIFDDKLASDMVMSVGREAIKNIFDSHPTVATYSVKYSRTRLTHLVTIVNGIQPWTEFLNGLAGEYTDRAGFIHSAEDKKQITRRFAAICSLHENNFDIVVNRGIFEKDHSELTQFFLYENITGNFGTMAEELTGPALETVKQKVLPEVVTVYEQLKQKDQTKISDPAQIPSKFDHYGEKNPLPDDIEARTISLSDDGGVMPTNRLSLDVSAIYYRHPEIWVEDHPNAEDDTQLVDATFHKVRKYRESLKPREGNYYDTHNECMRNSAGNVNGNTVDAEQDRTKVTLFSA